MNRHARILADTTTRQIRIVDRHGEYDRVEYEKAYPRDSQI
jgi:hypothetical protein